MALSLRSIESDLFRDFINIKSSLSFYCTIAQNRKISWNKRVWIESGRVDLRADSIIFREIRGYLDEKPEDDLRKEVAKLLFFQCFSLYGDTSKNH
jgi:hypothetical protein